MAEKHTTANSTKRPPARKRLFLVDGSSFCYRAFYAIRSLSTSRGEPTNAIYGFITMMKKLIEDEKPHSLAVCFDRKEPTFRHDRYVDYKAHRKPMPDELVQQLPGIKEFTEIYGLNPLEKAGFEADDLLGTITRKAEKEGFNVLIVTGDKDALQLVNENVQIYNAHKEGLIYDTETVRRRFDGLGPGQIVEIMALMGDSSDNIPGVSGIGEKTAVKLIKEFGSVEGLYKNLDKIKSKTLADSLRANKDSALMSRELAQIDLAVPIEVDWDKLELKPPDCAKLAEFYKRHEFRTLLRELTPTGEQDGETRCYRTVSSAKEFDLFLKELEGQEFFSFDTETTSPDPMRAHLVGMSFAWKPYQSFYIPVSSDHHRGPGLATQEILAKLKPLLENPRKKKAGQHIKYDALVLSRYGIRLEGVAFDTMIASYLVNPIKLNHNLDDISFEYLSVKKITLKSLLAGDGENKVETIADVPVEKTSEYACEDADCVFRLVPLLRAKLQEQELMEIFEKMELPLSGVLAEMEKNGVKIDLPLLKELSGKMGEDLERLTRQIYEEAGEEFNINSTKQLAEIFFVKKKFPVIKRTKTGYSTDVGVLEKLAETYALPKILLEYREKSKLKSTYFDALPEMVNPETGLIHTSFNQTVTATGRLSSSDPNLQNIPIKTETGREIRKAFIPRAKGRSLLSADYSQIELRILAHLSEDENLTKAFTEDRDIHAFTATLLYGVAEKDVAYEMRELAKTINFSIIYGKTAFGLSQDLKIPVSEADSFINAYFARYPGVRAYLDSQKEKARAQGYLTTYLGRRSYFPEIHAKNPQMRFMAERAAINAPIQGSAADLIKLAMIGIQRELAEKSLKSLMVIQVHDELVFDMVDSEREIMLELVRRQMEKAASLRVPLKVKLSVNPTWYRN